MLKWLMSGVLRYNTEIPKFVWSQLLEMENHERNTYLTFSELKHLCSIKATGRERTTNQNCNWHLNNYPYSYYFHPKPPFSYLNINALHKNRILSNCCMFIYLFICWVSYTTKCLVNTWLPQITYLFRERYGRRQASRTGSKC